MKSRWGSRIPELDGIRSIAIWMVLLLHVVTGFPNPPGALASMPRPVSLILGHRWLGVDLFFMLSGFLITGILLDTKDRPFYFKNFYVRRFLRIMPLYFAVVLVWSLCYRGHAKYFLLSSVFGANLSPLLHAGARHGPGVLWSLAVEEHFYLLWPAIVYWLDRRKLLLVCAALIIGCPILRGIFVARGMDPEVVYVLTWFRLDGLAAGAAIAIWARSQYCDRRTAHVITAALLVALIVMSLLGARFGLFGTKTVVAVALRYTQAYLIFGAMFILTLMYRDTIWTAPLRWRFMQFTGALSYCLYLVHLSLGDFYQFLYTRQNAIHFGPSSTVLIRGALFIGSSFAIATLSRKYLEEPFLALKDRFTSRPSEVSAKPELAPVVETPS
jgi:peptidoglycan/LPS O-acetylase OafA/YrhL